MRPSRNFTEFCSAISPLTVLRFFPGNLFSFDKLLTPIGINYCAPTVIAAPAGIQILPHPGTASD